jgi:hypothetical protein
MLFPDHAPDAGSHGSAPARDYLTSRSSGRRRSGGLESRVLSAVISTGDISSHNAFNSASVMRLSFILRSRAATDTKCAVSGLPPLASAARHSSRVARTESNRSSESTTGLSRYLTRRTHRLRSGWSITSRQLSSVRSILEAAGRPRGLAGSLASSSRCISGDTTIGTSDKSADAPRLATGPATKVI